MEMGRWMRWRGGIDEEDKEERGSDAGAPARIAPRSCPRRERAQPDESKSDENRRLRIMARKTKGFWPEGSGNRKIFSHVERSFQPSLRSVCLPSTVCLSPVNTPLAERTWAEWSETVRLWKKDLETNEKHYDSATVIPPCGRTLASVR